MATLNFSYTGSLQTYTVPAGVESIGVSIAGSAGGSQTYAGGYGAQVSAIIPVTPGHVLNIYVGGQSGVYGGGESGEYGGDGTFVVDATTGTLLMAIGGGGAGSPAGVGGGGGQVGMAAAGSYAGGGATTSSGGSSSYSDGSGPASFSGSTLTTGHGGSGVYGGGGGGYYGGGGGGDEYTTSYTYATGTYSETGSSTVYDGSTTGTSAPASSTSGSEAGGAVYYTYWDNVGVSSYQQTSQDNTVGSLITVPPGGDDPADSSSGSESSGETINYNWFQTATYSDGSTSWQEYILYTYYETIYTFYEYTTTTTYAPNYATGYTTNYNDGSGGGGASYVIPSAVSVSYFSAANSGLGFFDIVPPSAPDAAQLLSPISDTAFDASVSPISFQAVYHPTDGAAANGFVAQIEVSGATVGYFDVATGALSSSPVVNACSVAPGGVLTYVIPAGVLTNGNTYEWNVSFQESFGGLLGPYGASSYFITRADPVVVISSPTGSSTTMVGEIDASATAGPGASITGWRCLVYLQSTIGTTGFTWGQSLGIVWDSGVVSGGIPSAIVPQDLSPSPVYVAAVQAEQTGSQFSSWAPSGPFQFRILISLSGSVSSTSEFFARLASVNWSPGQINSVGALLPAVVSSTAFTSFTLVNGLHFATQQSQPVQLIPNDTFDSPVHYNTYSFPPLSSSTNTDFTTVGNVVASYLPDTQTVLINQGGVPAIGASHSPIRILATPVLAEGGTPIASGSSGGLVSPAFNTSAAGQLYVATRFVALDSLTADLQIMDASTNEVLVSWPLAAAAGQVIQAYRPYVIGSLAPASTPLQVALVVSGAHNSWVMQALSAFDEGIVWSFSVDAGNTWTDAYGIRNQPTGIVSFSTPGTELTWRASFYQQGLYVNALRIRPRYARTQPSPPPLAMRGPSVTFNDTTASIETDPMFSSSFVPIPDSWFIGSAVSATPSI